MCHVAQLRNLEDNLKYRLLVPDEIPSGRGVSNSDLL